MKPPSRWRLWLDRWRRQTHPKLTYYDKAWQPLKVVQDPIESWPAWARRQVRRLGI